ncbi:MAG: DUF4301 family protein [Bacteroidota bacterium]
MISPSMLSEKDLAQIASLGASIDTIQQQLTNFQNGFPFMGIAKAGTIGDGILKLNDEQIADYVQKFDEKSKHKTILKFVPASGAASRMFKALFAFMNSYDGGEEAKASLEADKGPKSMHAFFERIRDFAFASDLAGTMEGTLEEAIEKDQLAEIMAHLLTDKGLGYGQLPKGLLQFHSYGESTRTPFEEHLVEGAHYAKDGEGNVHLHFTVSPEHFPKFQAHLDEVKEKYEKEFGVTYHISFSEQKKSTDTIAVDMKNEPFRLDDGSILFRPGGHGALLANLNEQEADVMFIKNIDNVVPDHLKGETYRYKKALAGVLLDFQEKIFAFLKQAETQSASDEAWITAVSQFLTKEVGFVMPAEYAAMGPEEKTAYLISKLNRPVRVCGMVKNEGEPGGGPFWAENADSSISLQIVESAQIDKDDDEKQGIVQTATHFNPVDLICAPKDFQGNSFDLMEFRDPQTGFIAYKSKDGRELKAQELPGLWNGAMADWNTIFVEVPIITFNPVKTAFDLLRKEHQGE